MEEKMLLLRLKLSLHQGNCLISINLLIIARKENWSMKINPINKVMRFPNQFKKNKMNSIILLEKNYLRKKIGHRVSLENHKN